MNAYPVISYQTPHERLMETGELGDIWSAIGAIGASTVQLLPSIFGGGSTSAGGPAKGTAAITAFGQQAISTLQQILQLMQTGQLTAADAVSNAQRIVGFLSDGNYVYQAQHGDDAAALQQAKSTANQLLQQIMSAAGATTTPAGTNTNPSPTGTTQPAGNISIAGISITPTELLIGGAALFLLMGGLGGNGGASK